MRAKLKILISLFFTYGCNKSPEQKLSYLICKDSIQYWDYNLIGNDRNIWFTFSFDKNGNVKKYSFNKGKRWLFEDYPNKPNLEWSISNDSIFSFLDTRKRIYKISSDTIQSIDLSTKEKDKYYRVLGDLNIQKK